MKLHNALRIEVSISRQAALRPTAFAVTCGGQSLTYEQLNERANRIAHRLRSLGVGRNDLVAVAMERSTTMVVALLACLKSGGAYLPLDTLYPRDRLDFMLQDAKPRVLLTTAASAGSIPPGAHATLLLDSIDDDFAAEPASDPEPDDSLESLAYVIYTSGSTGRPKGCLVTHGNVSRLFTETEQWFGFGPDDVWTFFHSHAFDFSVWEIWGALIYGGRVVVVPNCISRAPAEFRKLLASERVTVLNQTPSAFLALSQADAAFDPADLSLRVVIFGGEALELQTLRPWFARHGDQSPRLVNMYGITETTVFVTYRPVSLADVENRLASVIGDPIPDLQVWLLDEQLSPVSGESIGEIYVGGAGVTPGYLNRPELTAERFIRWTPPGGQTAVPLYRSGDLARRRAGELEYLGRIDHQVKIRGYRIETGEIESQLNLHPHIHSSAVIARSDAPGGEARLVAYVVPRKRGLSRRGLREYLASRLPEFMVPAAVVELEELPLTGNGKLDRQALPAPSRERPDLETAFVEPGGELERQVAEAFARTLDIDGVGANDNFFDLGGTSLLAVRALEDLRRVTGRPVAVAAIFSHPSPAALAAAIARAGTSVPAVSVQVSGSHEPIAIIGMACRLPGSSSVEQFWNNLMEGRDLITRFSGESLDPAVPPRLRNDADYVLARGIIDGAEDFDAAFFGIPPKEAEITDPQQRIFLELAWECLERAGYAADRQDVPVGVFAGAGTTSYWKHNLLGHPEVLEQVGELQVQLGNDKDYIATRTAFKLNLKGPAVNVNTACSTSLVAVAQAVDSLRLGRCGMALAGAASLTWPSRSGYLFQEGAMLSRDGHTRTFDARAGGTVFSDGAAVVLLKPLSRAMEDGDQIHAVIRGIATNNDGGGKASFSAPSMVGQAEVIQAAQLDARVPASSISYVEAHGTATPLGDPVELEGLTRAFRATTADSGFCRIGSVKSNIGHAVTAAGAAGLIKTALALEKEVIPATIHFTAPNAQIDFAATPFVVNAARTSWPRSEMPRRAGVSSFGVGGTNAHAVIEEAPLTAASTAAEGPQLLMLSARSASALKAMSVNLAGHIRANHGMNLADAAFTLQWGRSRFQHRAFVVAEDGDSAIQALGSDVHAMRGSRTVGSATPSLVWMFPGQGAQYAGMGRALYAAEPAFREAFDECLAAFPGSAGDGLRQQMFSDDGAALQKTEITQPAIFCLEYALARMWLAKGVTPAVLIGHSIGEYAAAVVAGIMSLPDAARLVSLRGSLMQGLPPGSMLSVRMERTRLEAMLPPGLDIAAHNAAQQCVVAGPEALVSGFSSLLASQSVPARLLHISHAFHSAMMEAAAGSFHAVVSKVTLRAPKLPIISTLTGRILADKEAVDPHYWTRHLREPVQFFAALQLASREGNAAFLEVGPGRTLTNLVRQSANGTEAVAAFPTMGTQPHTERQDMLIAQGHLWTLGIESGPVALPATGRRRILLPSYPFERQRHVLQPAIPVHTVAAGGSTEPMKNKPVKAENEVSRIPRLIERLCVLFEEVSGTDLRGLDPSAAFIDCGLDSLVLTQAALQVKRTFGTPVTFRQLMEQHGSLDALARHLDAVLPPETAAPVVHAASVASLRPVPQPAPAGGDLIQDVIAQQMRIMNEQLELLRGKISPEARRAPAVPGEPAAPRPAKASTSTPVRYDVKKAFGAIARIHTQSNEITALQRANLVAFIDRYVGRTKASRAFTAANRSRLADPRVVNGFRPATKEMTYQVVVDRSSGSRVWDIDGNEYVDVLNGFGMNLFGWQPDFVQAAVRTQLDRGYEIGPQHPLAGEVADLICDLTGSDRTAFCNTGSEAVMAAVRIARTVTGRNTIVVFTGSYHGTFDEVLVRAGRDGKGIPAAPGIMSGMFGDIRVLDYGTAESLDFIRRNTDELAAVVVEPVQSRRPDFQPRDYLHELREITSKGGTCLVFDEVITGFRSHPGGAQAIFGVRADLACYGKVIGGGFPIGVVAGRRDYMDALDGGSWQYGDESIPTVGVTYFAGTFVRHPLALAAARASLLHLKQRGPQLQESLNGATSDFAADLNAFCRSVGAPVELRHFSSLWRMTWLEEHPLQDVLFAMMRMRGVHVLDNFPCFMTTAHSVADMELIKSAFRDSVSEMQQLQFLPSRESGSRAIGI